MNAAHVLEDCALCGGAATWDFVAPVADAVWVKCRNVELCVMRVEGRSVEEAFAKWNRRSVPRLYRPTDEPFARPRQVRLELIRILEVGDEAIMPRFLRLRGREIEAALFHMDRSATAAVQRVCQLQAAGR